MAYYLGIDGGGTKTRCALGDETKTLATAVTGGSNVIRLGEATARESLHASVLEACATAKVRPDQIHRVCIGAAGAARPEIASKIKNILAEVTPAAIEVVGDMVIALEAAFGTGPGVIVVAGTGSIVYGRDASGRTARAGGWGFAISDEGSGHWIGKQAVSAILRARDSGQETALASLILQAWSLHDLVDLVEAANATPPPDFPRLFPVVMKAAAERDSMARGLLADAGSQLAGLTAKVVTGLMPNSPHAPVAMTGSVFRQSAEVRQVFYNCLHARFPGIVVRNELVEPVDGALALARRAGKSKAG
ncbi:MAG TPA: BadF/BadG/BcrA/BcrD ATPase family protein [Terriglobales bacterium]|nr:BadF/BadG/BcrA/BcrD ATPase family protein [Terriglobales bacterium]